jgi:hypothetical protein
MCVFITAVPMKKLFAWEEEEDDLFVFNDTIEGPR